jgi:hypothetical protein
MKYFRLSDKVRHSAGTRYLDLHTCSRNPLDSTLDL